MCKSSRGMGLVVGGGRSKYGPPNHLTDPNLSGAMGGSARVSAEGGLGLGGQFGRGRPNHKPGPTLSGFAFSIWTDSRRWLYRGSTYCRMASNTVSLSRTLVVPIKSGLVSRGRIVIEE